MPLKLGRGVAIIGVGYTPIGDVRKAKEILNFTERELFAMASIEAMQDCGIKAKDIDAFYVGMSGANYDAKMKSAAAQFGEWIGMRHKPSAFHDEGCSTMAFGLEMAVNAVASGKFDTVLTGAVNVNTCTPNPCRVPFVREPMSGETLWNNVYTAMDAAYEKPAFGGSGPVEAIGVRYAIENGLSFEQMDEAFVNYIISKRHEAMLNPKALMATRSYEDEAKMFKFDSAEAYLTSEKFNPHVGSIIRARFLGQTNVDGASAIIVTTIENARKYLKQPIEVAGIATGTCMSNHFTTIPNEADRRVFKTIYEMAGITDPYHQVEYFSVHDCPCDMILAVTEEAGYFRKGEAYQFMRDKRLTFDQDKPVATSGGRTQSGHPRSPAFGIEVAEAVSQMRGENGARQMAKAPKVSVLWGGGTGWNVGACVLRTL